MGLDMYAYKTVRRPLPKVDFPSVEEDELLHYWRKHPNLHGWMKDLYRTKGGTHEDFNLMPVALTGGDIDTLEGVVEKTALPVTTGFFFGESQPEDIQEDREFIIKARKALAEGFSVYYWPGGRREKPMRWNLRYQETDEVPEAHQYGKTLQGRCRPCGVAYRWERRAPLPRRLYEARCPRCQRSLLSTTHNLKSVPWKGLARRVGPRVQRLMEANNRGEDVR